MLLCMWLSDAAPGSTLLLNKKDRQTTLVAAWNFFRAQKSTTQDDERTLLFRLLASGDVVSLVVGILFKISNSQASMKSFYENLGISLPPKHILLAEERFFRHIATLSTAYVCRTPPMHTTDIFLVCHEYWNMLKLSTTNFEEVQSHTKK